MYIRTSALVSIIFAFSVAGCSNSAVKPNEPTTVSSDKAEKTLRARGLELSDTGDFFLRYFVSLDKLREEPGKGSYKFQKRSGNFHDFEMRRWAAISYSSTLAGGEYSNFGYRLDVKTELVAFDQSTITFSIGGDFEFRRPRTDADVPGRSPIIWEAKQDFPRKTVSLEWGETRKITYDISHVERFAPFRDFIGNEITLTIANPEWSSTPWKTESGSD